MNGTYPGFYLWWQVSQRVSDDAEQERIGLRLWPNEPQEERVPATPDPLDYGRIAATW
jgi:hypothetical protein